METKLASSAAVLEVLYDEDNYLEWSVRVKTYLMAQALWDIVEATNEPPTPENAAAFKAWSKMNAMASHVIQISCGPDAFFDIVEITSARDAWNTLAEKYEVDLSTNSGESEEQGNIEIYMDLCKSLQIGDWNAANKFLNCHPHTISAKITVRGQTALHIAAEAGHVHIVEELVKQMSEENLEIRDNECFTALNSATNNGNYRIAECMFGKNELDQNCNLRWKHSSCSGSLLQAFKIGSLSLSLTPLEILEAEEGTIGATVVCEAIYNKALDIALDLVKRCPRLAVAEVLSA